MAARKVAINWTEFAKKVPEAQQAAFRAFQRKHFDLVKKVNSLPAELPKIDWDKYRKGITVPGMVDEWQKAYESLDIPYPKAKDNHLAKVSTARKLILHSCPCRIETIIILIH